VNVVTSASEMVFKFIEPHFYMLFETTHLTQVEQPILNFAWILNMHSKNLKLIYNRKPKVLTC